MADRRRRLTEMSLYLVLVAMFWAGTSSAQLDSDCTNELVSMSPCLNYITGNSSTPSSSCCTQLANVVRSSPECLCQVLNGGGSSLGINVNRTQALALPRACNVQTPPLSRCSPASPAETPAGTPKSPSGSRSETRPSTPDGSSGGSSIHSSKFQPYVLLFAAIFSSVFTAY